MPADRARATAIVETQRIICAPFGRGAPARAATTCRLYRRAEAGTRDRPERPRDAATQRREDRSTAARARYAPSTARERTTGRRVPRALSQALRSRHSTTYLTQRLLAPTQTARTSECRSVP